MSHTYNHQRFILAFAGQQQVGAGCKSTRVGDYGGGGITSGEESMVTMLANHGIFQRLEQQRGLGSGLGMAAVCFLGRGRRCGTLG